MNECLPPYEIGKDGKPRVDPPPSATDPEELKKQIMQRKELVITNIDSQQVDDVAKWFAVMKEWYRPIPGQPGRPIRRAQAPAVAAVAAPAAPGAPSLGAAAGPPSAAGPSGRGRIVQIYGRHFHNDPSGVTSSAYVHYTLLTKLASQKMVDLGVSFPVLIKPESLDYEPITIPGPKHAGDAAREALLRAAGLEWEALGACRWLPV